MNIAILIPELGGGGAERIAQIVGNYYFERGENVYYFLGDTSIEQVYEVKGYIINTGIKCSTERVSYGNIQILIRLLKSSIVMRRWKQKYHIDVSISFMEEFNYINVLSKGREKVITRVCTILSHRNDLKGLLYNKYLICFFYNLSDKVVVMSDYAKEDMHKHYGICYKKLKKIPNPSIRHIEKNKDLEWKYGEHVVICVGRLEKVKQQERIIRAFSYVKSHQENAKLLILGEGPNKIYLKKLCKKCAIDDSVDFIGFTNNVDFYLKHSRVFVMSSKVEGFPNSMVEAMACGVPIITTDSPGACGEIIGKRKQGEKSKQIQYCTYGILTPNISEKTPMKLELCKEELFLAKAIENVLSSQELYEKYKRQSLKRSAKYNLSKIMESWNELKK